MQSIQLPRDASVRPVAANYRESREVIERPSKGREWVCKPIDPGAEIDYAIEDLDSMFDYFISLARGFVAGMRKDMFDYLRGARCIGKPRREVNSFASAYALCDISERLVERAPQVEVGEVSALDAVCGAAQRMTDRAPGSDEQFARDFVRRHAAQFFSYFPYAHVRKESDALKVYLSWLSSRWQALLTLIPVAIGDQRK
jgi:hypothetical protein